MKAQVRQLLGLSLFATTCMGVGMGLSHRWVAQAQEDRPVVVDGKGFDRLPPIAEVAEKLNPTVVSIENTSFVKARGRAATPDASGGEFFDWFFGPRQMPRQSQEEQRIQAGGSGVIISPDGKILTNHHVVEGLRGGEARIRVKTSDGRTLDATVLGKDKEMDIALIKVDARHLPYAKLGDSDAIRVGEWVVAIGNPLGLEHTVTQGIISAKGRSARAVGGSGLESFLQTDAAINRGNSGGPLLNLRGEVVGINTAINPMGQNIGFAVPINLVKSVLADLEKGRPVSRGYLGVLPAELDKAFQDALGVKEGVVVSDVTKDTAADKAGILRQDVITSVNGTKVRTPDDLVGVIAGRRAGEAVTLGIVRDGKARDVKVVLGDRRVIASDAEEDAQDNATPEEGKGVNLEKQYGFRVEDLTPANRAQFRIAEDRKGVVVTLVAARSAAYEKLQPGYVISAVGSRSVKNLAEFHAEVRKASGRALTFLVQAPQGPQQITVAVSPR